MMISSILSANSKNKR